MGWRRRLGLVCCVVVCIAGADRAAAQAIRQPDAANLALARRLLNVAGGDIDATITGMRSGLIAMIAQNQKIDPARAGLLVDDAVLPVMREHLGALEDMLAAGYAVLLSPDDLKAALAFYASPAGKDFARAQPRMSQMRLAAIPQWISLFKPEIVSRVRAAMQTRGWATQ